MKKFKAILEAIGIALELAKLVESAIPGTGKGKSKLEFVIGAVGDVMGSIEGITPIVEKVVNRYVTAANAAGTFPTPPDTNTVLN